MQGTATACKVPACLIVFFCLLLLPAMAMAYGGGGGAEDNDLFPGTTSSSDQNKPPEGFDPSSGPGLDDMFTDYDTGEMDTSSVGSGDDQRELEDDINEQAGLSESKPQKPDRKTPHQQANEFLDTLPPEVRQQLVSQYTAEEIVTIRFISRLQNTIRNTKDPMMQGVLQQSLISAQANFVKNVQIRKQQRAAQLQRTQEDFNKVCSVLAGIGVNVMTGGMSKGAQAAGIAVNIAYNAATGGKKGAATAAVTTALTAPIPGGSVIGNAVRDAAIQEGLSAGVDAYNSK